MEGARWSVLKQKQEKDPQSLCAELKRLNGWRHKIKLIVSYTMFCKLQNVEQLILSISFFFCFVLSLFNDFIIPHKRDRV